MGTLKKQTAVEWLAQWLNDNPVVYQKCYFAAIEWAKAMEKEQILDAYDAGKDDHHHISYAKDYYNEKFGGDK
jgi:hypothetical protein